MLRTDINPARSRSARRRRLAAVGVLLLLGTLARAQDGAAFHDRGVARCGACHVTHEGGGDEIVFRGADPLLLAATPTDVCLACHGGNQGVFGLNPLAPPAERGAGNFVFLLEDNLNDAPNGATAPIHGEAAGHSIVSMDYGVVADSRWTTAPGGTFPSASLGCTSCHDPHGNGNFRMLNGAGPVQGGIFQFVNPAPLATGLDVSDPLATEARNRHTAYQSGMSEWCANCHDLFHDRERGESDFRHPSDERLEGSEANRYNWYEGIAAPRGGSAATAYLPEVPFEDQTATTTSTAGPGMASRVMCLTCHRAHGSSAPASGRWDFNVYQLNDDGVVSGSWGLPSPYSDPGQDSLCNKCHPEGPGHH